MTLRFMRLDYALRATMSLYEIETIAEYIYLYELAEKDSFWRTELKDKEESLIKAQNHLSDEIEQVILTHGGNSFHYFFDILNRTVESDPIRNIDYGQVTASILDHNEKMLATKNPEELTPIAGRPLIINTIYISQYSLFLGAAVTYFKLLAEPALNLYKADKLSPNGSLSYQTTASTLPALLNDERPKLKTSLNVKQLAYLFKLLKELKPSIFVIESDAELYRFISKSFTTKGKTEDLSEEKLRILSGNKELEIKVIDFWQTHLYTMLDNAKKHKF